MEREGMRQGGRGNNNVMFGTTGPGAHVTVVQQQPGGGKESVPPVEYEVDPRTDVEEHTTQQVMRRALTGGTALLVILLAVFSDLLQLSAALGLTRFQLGVPLVAACLLTILANLRQVRMLALPTDDRQDHYPLLIRRWVRKGRDGVYRLFDKVARCTHPRCQGVIRIEPAPPRERGNHVLAGVCSLGGRLHTFTVEHNGLGWPKEFDWRDPNPDR